MAKKATAGAAKAAAPAKRTAASETIELAAGCMVKVGPGEYARPGDKVKLPKSFIAEHSHLKG